MLSVSSNLKLFLLLYYTKGKFQTQSGIDAYISAWVDAPV